MAFKFVAILALLACAQADYLPTDLPYAGVFGYGSTIAPAAFTHGSVLSGYSPAAHLVEPLARASHRSVQAVLLNGFPNPAPFTIGGPLPEGKTTLSKTFVSTPTYVTSHVSNRVHTNEPKAPINSHVYGYDKNVINAVEAPLSYAAYYAGPNVPYGAAYGHVY
ncbi:uncharacterized protein LOC128718664 [Anopheles marshallii]|uniref:uncharacterized protein LOC128718664 n=1 Tax=Anopheles marshallii TaxID=1521116 RepID=UPI00237B8612|nr:uncharacterized protein LOC128718664 [Anopheles marshallii]